MFSKLYGKMIEMKDVNMKKLELIATTTFGLEAVCKRELIDLGFEVLKTENGKVTFSSDFSGIAKANLWLRSADRVLIKVGEFKAFTFDQLFDQVKKLPWSDIIDVDGNFLVKGKSVKSTLFSISDCQRITEKAIVENLKEKHHVSWFPKTGATFTVQVALLKDVATLTIDTSGDALHKRGYRINTVEAPMKETLAASLVLLSYWNKDRVLYDMFCGSGTIPIEAALIGRNIAPGLQRDFAFKHWKMIPDDIFKNEKNKAYQAIDYDTEISIYASDINEKNLQKAMENSEEAGVDDCIIFTHSDFKDLDLKDDYSVVISNPPYGERLQDNKEVQKLYQVLGRKLKGLKTWSKYFFTSYLEFEQAFNQKADRQRKLYNGRIEARYFQYYGPRPPRKDDSDA